MDSTASNYQLYIRSQELTNESFPPQCGLLIDLVEREWPDDFDLDTAPVPVLLDHAPDVLRRFCHQLITLQHSLRVVSPGHPVQIVSTADETHRSIGRLVSRARDESIYRTEIWCIPGGQASPQALDAIQGFEMWDRDMGMFDKALGLGAMRLTLEMSSLTLTLGCSDLADATDWVKYAVETTTLPVRWDL
jgi:hypothetical protein